MQGVIPRLHLPLVRQKLKRNPAVALIGPRQCGKTTLARQLGGRYFDLEAEGGRTRLDAEWDALVGGRELIVLDEVQHAPAVLARLRGAIDADRKRHGRFLLLGSVSPALMETASESLAGRLGLVSMSPFLLPELSPGQLDDLWLRGGYPDGGVLEPDRFPDWQGDFLEILVTRDLPTWGLPSRPPQTRRLLRMLAAVHGQALNASQLGASLSLDHKTVLRYCDFLEGAFLVRRLEPFAANTRKRLTKTPRLYWRDSGLLHALLGVSDLDQLYQQPWLGASWEGFVLEQTLATLAARNQRAQAFFFRTSDGHELDLVLDWGAERWAVEIKLTSAPSGEDVGRLNRAADMIAARRRFLVCRVAEEIENASLLVTDVPAWLGRLARQK
ncbi:MAG TPA: ATP-binding protein [Myxococcota bacterium]|nr:ATP-binding protein [Myxococcota bacterium]HRY94629.1 ATP-binding protein [Myxococcota bacterium]